MRIGPHLIDPPSILAPMAGVTDKPFRVLCKRLGAGLAVSEMTTSDPRLWRDAQDRSQRIDHAGEPAPISVQIAGADPDELADAARYNVEHGAEIVDINMGCPAKKVCNSGPARALLRDEALVARILDAVVHAVDVPVTLKIRTGWTASTRTASRIAKLAEDAGIRALARARPHARHAVQGRGRIRHDRRDQGCAHDPGVREWRRRFARRRRATCSRGPAPTP